MIHAWRIVKEKYAGSAFRGEGARLAGGRFNRRWGARGLCSRVAGPGRAKLPTDRLLGGYGAFQVSFDEALVASLEEDDLPANWRKDPAAAAAVPKLGDVWGRGGQSLVLNVPSAVVPAERNYLINPHDAAFGELEIRGPIDPGIDPRLTQRAE